MSCRDVLPPLQLDIKVVLLSSPVNAYELFSTYPLFYWEAGSDVLLYAETWTVALLSPSELQEFIVHSSEGESRASDHVLAYSRTSDSSREQHVFRNGLGRQALMFCYTQRHGQ